MCYGKIISIIIKTRIFAAWIVLITERVIHRSKLVAKKSTHTYVSSQQVNLVPKWKLIHLKVEENEQ